MEITGLILTCVFPASFAIFDELTSENACAILYLPQRGAIDYGKRYDTHG